MLRGAFSVGENIFVLIPSPFADCKYVYYYMQMFVSNTYLSHLPFISVCFADAQVALSAGRILKYNIHAILQKVIIHKQSLRRRVIDVNDPAEPEYRLRYKNIMHTPQPLLLYHDQCNGILCVTVFRLHTHTHTYIIRVYIYM